MAKVTAMELLDEFGSPVPAIIQLPWGMKRGHPIPATLKLTPVDQPFDPFDPTPKQARQCSCYPERPSPFIGQRPGL